MTWWGVRYARNDVVMVWVGMTWWGVCCVRNDVVGVRLGMMRDGRVNALVCEWDCVVGVWLPRADGRQARVRGVWERRRGGLEVALGDDSGDAEGGSDSDEV